MDDWKESCLSGRSQPRQPGTGPWVFALGGRPQLPRTVTWGGAEGATVGVTNTVQRAALAPGPASSQLPLWVHTPLQDLPRACVQHSGCVRTDEKQLSLGTGHPPQGNDAVPRAVGPPPRRHRPRVSPPSAEKEPPTAPAQRGVLVPFALSLCSWAHVVILGQLRSRLLQATGTQMAWDTLMVSASRWS